jgi:hypothetical protein
VHVGAAALDPHGVGKIAKRRKVMAFARIENDPDRHASTLRGVQDHDRVCQSVGREVDRTFRAGNQLGVDRVEPLLGREVNLVGVECGRRREDAEHGDETQNSRIHLWSKDPDFRHQSPHATTRQCGRAPRRTSERHILPCAPIAACFVRSRNLLKRHATAIRAR